jgi:hypothetical protein
MDTSTATEMLVTIVFFCDYLLLFADLGIYALYRHKLLICLWTFESVELPAYYSIVLIRKSTPPDGIP